MKFFEVEDQRLVWRNHGETLVVEPWGADSLRVRSALMREVKDERFALQDPAEAPGAEVVVENEKKAYVRNGKITALVEVCGWKEKAKITFLNGRNEVLLQETDGENALLLQARKFEPIPGGSYSLTATFAGRDGERIYGMGQYQEEYLDWKGCTLELAHRGQARSKVDIRQMYGDCNKPARTEFAWFVAVWTDWLLSGSPRNGDGSPIIPSKVEIA